MVNPIFKVLVSELTDDEQKLIKAYIETLPKWFRRCERELQGYDAENQNVIKLLNIMKETRVMIDDAMNELIEKHRLPTDIMESSAELVSAMRHAVTQAKR